MPILFLQKTETWMFGENYLKSIPKTYLYFECLSWAGWFPINWVCFLFLIQDRYLHKDFQWRNRNCAWWEPRTREKQVGLVLSKVRTNSINTPDMRMNFDLGHSWNGFDYSFTHYSRFLNNRHNSSQIHRRRDEWWQGLRLPHQRRHSNSSFFISKDGGQTQENEINVPEFLHKKCIAKV